MRDKSMKELELFKSNPTRKSDLKSKVNRPKAIPESVDN